MKLFALILAIVTFGVACTDTATIKRRDAPPVEAKIVAADQESVYVELPLVEGSAAIPRTNIADIDHPGNVHLLIGSIFTGFGVAMGALTVWLFGFTDDPFLQVVGLQLGLNAAIYLGVGVPMGVWGFRTWKRSTSIVKKALGPLKVVVAPMQIDEKFTLGLGLKGTF